MKGGFMRLIIFISILLIPSFSFASAVSELNSRLHTKVPKVNRNHRPVVIPIKRGTVTRSNVDMSHKILHKWDATKHERIPTNMNFPKVRSK